MVRRCPSYTASTAAMRPLIAAEPMLRAPRPEMVSESTVTGLFDAGTTGADSPAVTGCVGSAAAFAAAVSEASGMAGASVDFVPGITKRALSIGTFASILVMVIFCRNGLPLRPNSWECGRYQPLTLL